MIVRTTITVEVIDTKYGPDDVPRDVTIWQHAESFTHAADHYAPVGGLSPIAHAAHVGQRNATGWMQAVTEARYPAPSADDDDTDLDTGD